MKTLDKAIQCLDAKYPENQKQADSFAQKLGTAAKQVQAAMKRIEADRKKINDNYEEYSRIMNYLGRETAEMFPSSVDNDWEIIRDAYMEIK